MKLIHAEDGGMVMYVKRLEAGRFRIPQYDPQTCPYGMEWNLCTTSSYRQIRQFQQLGMQGLTESTVDGWFKGTRGLLSLLSSCRNHDVNPRDYLNDIIARMPCMAKAIHKEIVELLPHKWNVKAAAAETSKDTKGAIVCI